MTVMDAVGRLVPDDIRKLFLFEKLTDEQVDWLAEHGWVAEVPGGAVVLAEGADALALVILLDGTISMSKRVGQDDVEINRTEQVGVYAGATQSYLEGGDVHHYTATVRAVSDVRLFVLPADDFAWAVRTWFPMAMHLLEGIFLGLQNSQQIIGQRQRLLALGALSAGLTHELNNPAAAASRATSALRERFTGMRHKFAKLAHDEIDPRLLEVLVDLQEEAVGAVASAPRLSALEEGDREDGITAWLEEREVAGAWDLAPIFVSAGATTDLLERVAARAPADVLGGALQWLANTLETELLLDEVADSVARISTLVAAAKEYSNMDRSPQQRVDIHDGIDSTLVMLSAKLKHVAVETDFDRSIPAVPVFSGELNQVWTNLIDNAIHATDGRGTISIRTRLENECVRVDIADDGPGIPADLRQRIFDPFFTTKPVGQGTGLGLDISYRIVVARHGGDLTVESTPGDTRFIVRIPLTQRREPSIDAAGTV
jgi:signal transduction histidine kinase